MATDFTGVQVLEGVGSEVFNELYSKGSIPVESVKEFCVSEPYPNSFLVIKGDGKSAVSRISPNGQSVLLIRDSIKACGLSPKNKEQAMLLSTLLDPAIPVQIVSGKAGSGKTLLTIAAAMHAIEEGTYERIILTKPMSQVGKYDLGILPGTIEEKFAPFLANYATNIERLLGSNKKNKARKGEDPENKNGFHGVMADFITYYNVEVVPMQLMRGASFHNSFIIADEIQVLGHHEMLTIGSRVAENSKIVLMGDLGQRDEKIKKVATGLYKCINDPKMKSSGLVSYIQLMKTVRGPVAELFADVFESEE